MASARHGTLPGAQPPVPRQPLLAGPVARRLLALRMLLVVHLRAVTSRVSGLRVLLVVHRHAVAGGGSGLRMLLYRPGVVVLAGLRMLLYRPARVLVAGRLPPACPVRVGAGGHWPPPTTAAFLWSAWARSTSASRAGRSAPGRYQGPASTSADGDRLR